MTDLSPERAKRAIKQLGTDSTAFIYLVDPDWQEVYYVSDAYADIFGHPVEDILADARGFLEYVHPEDRERVEADIERATQGETVENEFRVAADGTEERWVSTYTQPVYDDTGAIDCLSGIVRDISDRKNQQRRFEQQRDRLEVLNEVVRHDLRNDMQVVRGRGRLLEDHVTEEGRRHLEDMLHSTEDAIDITKTARDLTRTLVDGHDEYGPVSVTAAIDEAVETARSQHERAVITTRGLGQDARITADDMLEALIHNLVQNAIVHNDKQMPEVEVAMEVDDEAGTVTIDVVDNGPGVPEDRKEAIFGKGEKGLDSPGTGLGLYLVQTLAGDYGGRVWVEDNEPEGSVFRVELPLVET